MMGRENPASELLNSMRAAKTELIFNAIGAGNCTAATSVADFSSEELLKNVRAAKAKFDAIQKKHLRHSAELVEQTTCGVCGRKPTVTRDGYGETIVICPHLWEALQKHAKPADPRSSPSSLTDIRFEVFDDGPRRW